MSCDFTLDVADVRFRVQLPEPKWLVPLTTRYAEFIVPAEAASQPTPPWHVALVHAAGRSNLDAPWAVHEGDVTRFGISVHEGWIDLDRRWAEVSAPSPEQAASALDRVVGFICMQALPREHNGLLLHGAGIVLDGTGLACCGPSGTGKTTVSRLAAGHAEVFTDETLVVSLAETRPMLLSTPFWGASTPPEMIQRRNRRLPLRALLLLEHGLDFALEPLDHGQAVLSLLATEKVAVERVSSALAWLVTVERLVAQVPVYRLSFRPTAELWTFLAQALSNDVREPE